MIPEAKKLFPKDLARMMAAGHPHCYVATASVGAGFYTLMALSAWLVYGETLSGVQWTGIVLVTLGVVCISLGGVTP